MILKTHGRNRASFGAFDSSFPIPRASQWHGGLSHSGKRITLGEAVSLPAFLRGVRLICETSAGLPIRIFRGYDEKRRPIMRGPQLDLLRQPNLDQSTFGVWTYVIAAMLRGNAYLWKVKVKGETKALYAVNPAFVTPDYTGDRPTFEIRDMQYGPVREIVGRDRIIHIPGITLEDPYIGISVVEAHKHSLGTALGRQEFEGRFIANDGTPGIVLKNPGNTTSDQRTELRESWMSRHSGAHNAGRPGILWGGWEIDRVAVSLEDAQFIESQKFTVQDIGRMLGVPAGLLGDPDAPGNESPEQENMRFVTYGLNPWMLRLEQGLTLDVDLFPEPDWSVEFDTRKLLRADIKTRFDAYRLARQGGWITANEIRGEEGRDSVDGGDEIQQTPVGGAPNTASNPNGSQEAVNA